MHQEHKELSKFSSVIETQVNLNQGSIEELKKVTQKAVQMAAKNTLD